MMIRVHPPDVCGDLEPGIIQAVKTCADALRNPPIGNFGLKGIEKWAKQVLKWPTQFPGRGTVDCLTSLYTYIEIGGTGGSAFRKMYARFLREAAAITGRSGFGEAAAAYDVCAAGWRDIAFSALPENVPALRRCRELLDAGKNAGSAAAEATAVLDEIDTSGLMGNLNVKIRDLHKNESKALDLLEAAVS
ncbi:MAG: DUF4872 domain-containing protein, partial [Spirochaetales bacterium]|nr:DUF4872 domain-containing protein [Spirochaetales bacterium]